MARIELSDGTWYDPVTGESGDLDNHSFSAPGAGAASTMNLGTGTGTGSNPMLAWIAGQQAQARQGAIAWLTSILGQYGLGSMAGAVSSLIQEWGTNTDVIALKLRETAEYKDRFKGLLALQQRGITDVTNEAQYIQLESEYRRAFRDTGLGDFLGEAGSSAERDSIADLVGKFSVSVNEVRDRISDAQRIVGQDTPQEVKDAWALYYGVDSSQLVRYVLDPEKTAQQINRQANAALLGGLSAQAGLQVGAGTAGRVADLFGTGDMTAGQVTSAIQSASTIADATKRLAAIDNIDLSNDEIVDTAFGTDAGAEKKVKGLQSRERARFGGSSAFGRGSLGRGTGT